MRNVFAALVGLLMMSVCLPAQDGGNEGSVGVYLKLADEPNARILQHMRKEVAHLLSPTGVRLDWRFMSDARLHEEFQSVVVARLDGRCTAAYGSNAARVTGRPVPLLTHFVLSRAQ